MCSAEVVSARPTCTCSPRNVRLSPCARSVRYMQTLVFFVSCSTSDPLLFSRSTRKAVSYSPFLWPWVYSCCVVRTVQLTDLHHPAPTFVRVRASDLLGAACLHPRLNNFIFISDGKYSFPCHLSHRHCAFHALKAAMCTDACQQPLILALPYQSFRWVPRGHPPPGDKRAPPSAIRRLASMVLDLVSCCRNDSPSD